MVSINYPSFPSGPDLSGFERGLAGLGDIVQERRTRKVLDQFADSLYGGQGGGEMSLASLAPRETSAVRTAAPPVDYASQRVAQAHAASGGGPQAGAIEAYIRHAAQKRGIDPDVAVKVAMSEGGVSDPTRQSDVVKDGVREQSYGPFQLYMNGGLGNEALAAGIDPRKDWQRGIDFALDKAKEGGWGPWYGAAKAGIGERDGIGGPQALAEPSGASQGVQMAQSAPAGTDGSLLPPREVMRGLLSNPQTRELGVALAREAQKARIGDPEAALRLEKLRLEVEKLRNPDADGTEYGLNPQTGVDENGNPVLIQLGKNGTSIRTPLPDGVSLSKAPIRLDAGTHFVLLDPITRQPVGQIPKDLAGAEAQREIGSAEGKAAAAAPGDFQAGANALDLVDSLRNDPNRPTGTGWSGRLGNWIPATPGYDFQTKVDQAKSGAFLSAIQQLRGMGALSNAEGDTATKATTRMNTASSEAEFLNALADYEKIVRQGMARAQRKADKFDVEMPAGGTDYKTKYGLD